jgi:hypothetical protein
LDSSTIDFEQTFAMTFFDYLTNWTGKLQWLAGEPPDHDGFATSL